MIGIKVNDIWLDLNDQKIGLEIYSPFFIGDRIPGVLSYPFSIDLKSRNNRKALGWPDRLEVLDKPDTIHDVELYLMGTLYRKGVLKYRGQKKLETSYNFQADSAAFNALTKGIKLRDIDFGTIPYSAGVVNGHYPEYSYAQFPVKNEKFYGSKNEDFSGYLNYYDDGFRGNLASSAHTRVIFPYLVYVLQQAFEMFGYQISGSWLTDPDIVRAVVMNNFALDKISGANGFNIYTNVIELKNHLPDMTVNEMIIAVKSMFGLGIQFDSQQKSAEFIRLDDVITAARSTDQYVDWTQKADRYYEDTPIDYKGYRLRMTQDNTDELLEEFGNDWLEYVIDGGKEDLPANVSPLHMLTEEDQLDNTRQWTIPAIKQAGSSEEFDLGINHHPFRLMYYRGFKNQYPYADYRGDNLDLRWQGDRGLYQKCWKNWLDFREKGIPVKRKVNLNMADVSTLDPTTPVMIDHLKFIWSSIRLNVGNEGLGRSDVNMVLIK